MYGKLPAYNTYATMPTTNSLFMGFSGYQNVNKEIIQPNIEKEQQTPKIQYFRGFIYILKIYQTLSKHTKMFRQLTGNTRVTDKCFENAYF